jgi:hypothetical protein
MTKYSKFNPIYRLQKWLDSVPGQTFMNYAYSWGAAIVIAGALFKLTHLPGANFWLFLGMGTEIFVFFISGFDRPFDKTEDGKDLPTHVKLDDDEDADGQTVSHTAVPGGGVIGGGVIGGGIIGGGIVDGETVNHTEGGESFNHTVGGGTIVIGGGGGTTIIGGAGGGVVDGETVNHSVDEGGAGVVGGTGVAGGTGAAGVVGGGIIGGVVAPELPELNPDMEEATNNYVEQLKKLTETLQKVSDQSERLTRDSEEMENLNRTLTGICKVYEMQLKGASQQIGTIDEINDQTRKMADQIAELNRIYARMIEAMTVNMPKLNQNNNGD